MRFERVVLHLIKFFRLLPRLVQAMSNPYPVDPLGTQDSHLSAFGRMLTKTRAFDALVHRAFDIVDDSGEGKVDEAELYAGLLMVHLKLANYAGPAALYPPSRATCDLMFRHADSNKNGLLNREEFKWVMGVMCANILGRMFVFYAVMILGLPFLTNFVVELFKIPEGHYKEKLVRAATTIVVLYGLIPILLTKVDEHYNGKAPGPEQELLTSDRQQQREKRSERKSLAA